MNKRVVCFVNEHLINEQGKGKEVVINVERIVGPLIPSVEKFLPN